MTGCSRPAATSAPSADSSLPRTSEGATSTAAASTTTGAPFAANTDPDTSQASADASVTVRDIRISPHDGFDQVVFEFGGTGTPGWDVRYVEQASQQGSGKPISVQGDAILQVSITGAGYPWSTGVAEYSGPNPLSAAGTTALTQLVFDSTYEGMTQAFAGTTARLPFRAYALQNPTRLVVEIAGSA